MNSVRVRIVVGVLLLLGITGCQTARDGTRSPRFFKIDVGESRNMPLKAAGFERGEISAFQLKDDGPLTIVVTYNYLESDAQIVATLYFIRKDGSSLDVDQRFEDERSNIEKLHSGAKLIAAGKEVFVKNGVALSALTAKYELEGFFMNRNQPVYSELMLVEHGDKFIKLRSSSPRSQYPIASKKNIELMNAVKWEK